MERYYLVAHTCTGFVVLSTNLPQERSLVNFCVRSFSCKYAFTVAFSYISLDILSSFNCIVSHKFGRIILCVSACGHILIRNRKQLRLANTQFQNTVTTVSLRHYDRRIVQ